VALKCNYIDVPRRSSPIRLTHNVIRPETSGDWNLEAWKGFRQALRDCCFVDILCERFQHLRMRKEKKTVTKAELIVLTNDFRWAFDEDMDELMSEANEMFGLRADKTRPEFYVDGACSFLRADYDAEKRKASFDPRVSTFAPRQKNADSCSFTENDRVYRNGLDADWKHMQMEFRIKDPIFEASIRKPFESHYKDLCHLFRFWSWSTEGMVYLTRSVSLSLYIFFFHSLAYSLMLHTQVPRTF